MSSHVPISLRDPFWDDPTFSSSRSDFDSVRRDMMRQAKDFWSNVDEDEFMRGGSTRSLGGGYASPATNSDNSSSFKRTVTTSTSTGSGPDDMVTRRTTTTSSGTTPEDAITRRTTTTSGPGAGVDDILGRRSTGTGAVDDLLTRRTLSRQYSNPTSYPRWLFPDYGRYCTSTDLATTPGTGRSGGGELGLYGTDSQVMRIKEDDTKFEITLDVQNFKPDELKVRTQPDNTVIIEGKHEERSGDRYPERSTTKSASGITTEKYGGFQSAVSQQFNRKFTLPTNCDPLRVVSNLSRDGVMVVTAPKRPPVGASATGVGLGLDRNIPVRH